MGLVADLLEALRKHKTFSYSDVKVSISLDKDSRLESLSLDPEVDLDEEDLKVLGPFFWREALSRVGFSVSFVPGPPSLFFEDKEHEYWLQVEKEKDSVLFFGSHNSNPFTAFYFSNAYQHDNIMPVKKVSAITFGPYLGFLSTSGKRRLGKEEDLSALQVQQLFNVLLFLHENGVTYNNLSMKGIHLEKDKVLLCDFSKAKRNKGEIKEEEDLSGLGILLFFRALNKSSSENKEESKDEELLIKKMVDKSISLKDGLKEFERIHSLPPSAPKGKAVNYGRYLSKAFISDNSGFFPLFRWAADKLCSGVEDDRHYLLSCFYLLNKVSHSFSKADSVELSRAIAVLVSAYYGLPLKLKPLDSTVFKAILHIIKATKGLPFQPECPAEKDLELKMKK